VDTCPTVRIVSEEHKQYGGFKVINESDLGPDDVIWKEKAVAPAPAADEFSDMKNDDLKNFLTLSKVEFDVKANKAELQALCRAVPKE